MVVIEIALYLYLVREFLIIVSKLVAIEKKTINKIYVILQCNRIYIFIIRNLK